MITSALLVLVPHCKLSAQAVFHFQLNSCQPEASVAQLKSSLDILQLESVPSVDWSPRML